MCSHYYWCTSVPFPLQIKLMTWVGNVRKMISSRSRVHFCPQDWGFRSYQSPVHIPLTLTLLERHKNKREDRPDSKSESCHCILSNRQPKKVVLSSCSTFVLKRETTPTEISFCSFPLDAKSCIQRVSEETVRFLAVVLKVSCCTVANWTEVP